MMMRMIDDDDDIDDNDGDDDHDHYDIAIVMHHTLSFFL